jgi:thioredoxin-related protein
MKNLFVFVLGMVTGFSGHAQSTSVQWLTWEQMVPLMEKNPKKIMVDVYTDWCGWCKKMDANTMTNSVIVSLLSKHFYAVKLDGEHKKDIVFKGRTFKFVPSGYRGYHELPAELMNGKMSYPTLVFLDEEFGIIQALPGYQDPKSLEPVLNYFGKNLYKTVTWEGFKSQFKSELP